MGRFAVLKKIGDCAPHVDNTFDNEADAKMYVEIMRRRNDGWEYALYVMEEF